MSASFFILSYCYSFPHGDGGHCHRTRSVRQVKWYPCMYYDIFCAIKIELACAWVGQEALTTSRRFLRIQGSRVHAKMKFDAGKIDKMRKRDRQSPMPTRSDLHADGGRGPNRPAFGSTLHTCSARLQHCLVRWSRSTAAASTDGALPASPRL